VTSAVTSTEAGVLNRVLNLETGSLAVEAALKMILAPFYRPEASGPQPSHAGQTPVILVVGQDDGSPHGNYHGTTVLTQVMRGLWPEFQDRSAAAGLFEVVAVRPNVIADVAAAFQSCHGGTRRIAGFFHEIVMMNYGARLLTRDFLSAAHELCRTHDVPTVVDEIQSGAWYDGLLLCRELELRPSFIALGKGFPGGEYPASRLLFEARFDCLPQFGALVTNGQEELASLAYLVTMRWVEANGARIRAVGDRIMARFHELVDEFPGALVGVEGHGHLAGLAFQGVPEAKACVERVQEVGFDISVQAYKADCPPVALTKLPVIADEPVVDALTAAIREALASRNQK